MKRTIKTILINNNLDMDQQSIEFWNNLQNDMIVGNIVPNYVWINQLISSRLFMTNIVKSLKEMKLWKILSR